MDLAHEEPFLIGALLVEPALRRISSPQGDTTIEPKMMQVLVVLGREPGIILSHDDLIDLCWAGTTVGDGSVNRVIFLLRKALCEVAGEGVWIETLPKVGYRLRVAPQRAMATRGDESRHIGRLLSFRAALGATLLLLVGLGLATAMIVWPSASGHERLAQTVAVLPAEWSGREDPFLAAGLEAELREHLARSAGLTVSGVASTRDLARAGLGPVEIGKRLGADFVVRNDIRSDGNAISVSSRLIPVDGSLPASGVELSSGQPTAASLPARLAREILVAMGRDPVGGEAEEIGDELDRRIYLVAYGMVHSRDRAAVASARKLLDALRDRYPNSAKVFSLTAKAVYFGDYANLQQALEKQAQARVYARRALRLDPNSIEALKVAGLLEEDPTVRLRLLETAVRLEPTDAEAWLWLSNERTALDDARPSLEAIRQVALLDPLWSRSWQAPGALASFGLAKEAEDLDRSIIAAAQSGWQAELARARILQRRGDLSAAWRTMHRIAAAAEEGAPVIFAEQYSGLARLLGLPSKTRAALPRAPLDGILDGRLPDRPALLQAGLAGKSFWDLIPFQALLTVLMVRDGRDAELVDYYDAAFSSPRAFDSYLSGSSLPLSDRAYLAVYMGRALDRDHREAEAREVWTIARRDLDRRLSAEGPKSVEDFVAASALFAVLRQKGKSLAFLRQAQRLGWPYTATSELVALAGPLRVDPVFRDVLKDPAFASLISGIRHKLRREAGVIAAAEGDAAPAATGG